MRNKAVKATIVATFVAVLISWIGIISSLPSAPTLPLLPTHTSHLRKGELFIFDSGHLYLEISILRATDKSVPNQSTGVYTDYLTIDPVKGTPYLLVLAPGSQFLWEPSGFYYDKKTGLIKRRKND